VNVKRIYAVAHKETQEIVRDRLFFALAFIVPAVLMALFGFGLSLDVEKLPLAIIDRDGTPLSREYAHRFIDSRFFDFKGYSFSEGELERPLTDNVIRAAIIIPENFQRDLLQGRPAHVQTLIDGTFPFRALTAKGYVIAINAQTSVEFLASYLAHARGLSLGDAAQALQPISLEVRYLFNQSLKSIWSLAPKLIMAILMISPPFLTALGVVREKETGSIYNIYASTLSRGEYLIGKSAPYVAISTLNALVLWVMATGLFGAPFKGPFLFFLLSSVLYVTCTTGIGVVVSVIVRTQVAAMIGTAIFTVVPAVLYSGVLIPISSLSQSAKVVAYLLPGMYYTNIVMGTFLKGVGFAELWRDVLVLAIYAMVLFSVGYAFFRKRPTS